MCTSQLAERVEENAGKPKPGWLLLCSFHPPPLQPRSTPPSPLSSRPKRSVVGGSAVCVGGETEPVGNSPRTHSLCRKGQTADPSTTLRFGRDDKGEGGDFMRSRPIGWTEKKQQVPPLRFAQDDDKVEGGVAPWLWWRGMERVNQPGCPQLPGPSTDRWIDYRKKLIRTRLTFSRPFGACVIAGAN